MNNTSNNASYVKLTEKILKMTKKDEEAIGKGTILRIIARSFLLEQLLHHYSDYNFQNEDIAKEVGDFLSRLQVFFNLCLNKLNKHSSDDIVQRFGRVIDYIQDKILAISVRTDIDNNIIYIEKIGLSQKEDTISTTLEKIKEYILNNDYEINSLLISSIRQDLIQYYPDYNINNTNTLAKESNSQNIFTTEDIFYKEIEKLLSYVRPLSTKEKEEAAVRNPFLKELGKLAKRSLEQTSQPFVHKFFIGYDNPVCYLGVGTFVAPQNMSYSVIYEDAVLEDKEKGKKRQTTINNILNFVHDLQKKQKQNNSAKQDSTAQVRYIPFSKLFGKNLYNELKSTLFNSNDQVERSEKGVLEFFFLLCIAAMLDIAFQFRETQLKKNQDITHAIIFCLEQDNYPVWNIVRQMYKNFGIPVQTLTQIALDQDGLTYVSGKKNLYISLLKNIKHYRTYIETIDSIPKDSINFIFIVEEQYPSMFSKKRWTTSNDAPLPRHALFHTYKVSLTKQSDKQLNIDISSDIPIPLLATQVSDATHLMIKKIQHMIGNHKEEYAKTKIVFISPEPERVIQEIQKFIENHQNEVIDNKAEKIVSVTLDNIIALYYNTLAVPKLKASPINKKRYIDRGYIVDSEIIQKVFKDMGFRRFEHFLHFIGIKPMTGVASDNPDDDFFKSSNLHMFGSLNKIDFDLIQMFIYALLGLSGYFSESVLYAYKSFDFHKKSGKTSFITRKGYNYPISFLAVLPELVYQQQILLVNDTIKQDNNK